MKYTTALVALMAGANAHTLMSEFYVNGEGQGDGTCVRTPEHAKGAVDPITDLQSSDMACGQDGLKGVERVCSVDGGSSLTFEYRQWPDDVSKGPLDEGHAGPCSVYLKKVDNAVEASGTGDGWFKLWDDGYDESSGKWCTQKMIGNNGRITVTIPDSLQGGDYLVRPELIALHNVPKGIPEYYVGCAQVFLDSAGSGVPTSTVSIPGFVDGSEDGLTFNIYDQRNDLASYKIPGPDVAELTSAQSVASTNRQQTDGLPEEGCILTNANWCAVEIPDFSDEQGCWDADKDCWNQLDECYDTAPPTGSANCKIWEQKCKRNQDVCRSSNPSGPADKGKVLTPDTDTISVPNSVNANLDYGSGGAPSNSNSGSSDDSNSDDSNSGSSESNSSPSSTAAPAATSSTENSNDEEIDESYSSPPFNPEGDDSDSDGSDNSDDSSAPSPPSYEESEQDDSPPAPATTFATKVTQAPNNVVVETQMAYETVNVVVTVNADGESAEPTPAADNSGNDDGHAPWWKQHSRHHGHGRWHHGPNA
ncbi:hypothetical protein MBLNU230_g4829t1 [Neophaeotheca triangularis]